ncbi:DUF5011 domain-containing protein [Lacticaseibacillus paracasei]|uniref:DUF5011 domain-containing protein n=1 Tax=Lacticaseibacillus paracasei TaxID=1597 RepID=A0ABD7BZ57_LACPA|nr:DUF5011 domain-containing protein [Lacticaseibacillus paracasei]QOP57243.1 DUF5011 domain-containing protein [Lacticaseibacillus paracasei]
MFNKKKKTAAILLISAVVLGGGGYAAYQLNAAPTSQSAKKSSSSSKQWLFPSEKKDSTKKKAKEKEKESSSSNKTEKEIQAALAPDLPSGSNDNQAASAFPFSKDDLSKQLASSNTQNLVSLADQGTAEQNTPKPADNTPTAPEPTPTPVVEMPTPTPTPTPDSQTPGNQTPGNQTPGDQTPGNQTPGDQTPGNPTPVDQAPVISFADVLYLHLGQKSYDLLDGVSAHDAEDGDLTHKVVYASTVDINTEGTYQVTYQVTDSAGHTVSATRDVVVTNDAPVIHIASDNRVEVGHDFDPKQGVTADDYQDGDLTSAIKVTGTVDTSKPGDYELTYEVTDKNGAVTSVKRTVSVFATAPTLDVSKVPTTLKVGDKFEPMANVNATSPYGAVNVTVYGSVDTSKPGSNDLTYTVTDKFGQKTVKQVTVNVEADKPTLDLSKVPTKIKVGDQFDPKANVTATSPYGAVTVDVDGSVDTSKPGSYELTYTVTDKFGQSTTQTLTITVSETV